MALQKRSKNKKKHGSGGHSSTLLPPQAAPKIVAILLWLLAIIFALSFIDQAGVGGRYLAEAFYFLIGQAFYALPLALLAAGLVLVKTNYRHYFAGVFLGILLLLVSLAAFLAGQDFENRPGGVIGYGLAWLLFGLFGQVVANLIFLALLAAGLIILWQLLLFGREAKDLSKEKKESKTQAPAPEPKKEVKPVPSPLPEPGIIKSGILKALIKSKGAPDLSPATAVRKVEGFRPYPLELLDEEKGKSEAGDIERNKEIIKTTLANFAIEVEMGPVNVGPTVTQYTLKPAEGVKLSKITDLASNLSLALAAHPIRIEAPIPGKALVGIELPNRERQPVRLRNLLASDDFRRSVSPLTAAFGRDVAGEIFLSDVDRMPHLMVAGSTGAGKTCAADTLLLTEKGMLTFEELYPLPLNTEADFKIKLVTRDGIEQTAKSYNNGICQFYKLTTQRGYELEATAEHPLWVINEDGSQSWKSAALLKKGDYVAISRGPALFGSKVDLSDFKPSEIKTSQRKISFPSKMIPQLAQFLGLLTAGGSLSVEKQGAQRVTYTQVSAKSLALYKKLLRELFGITQFIEKPSGSELSNKAKDIVIDSLPLKEFLAYLGMKAVKSSQREAPRAIREAPKEMVIAYLQALFDNVGYSREQHIELSSSSKKLLSQIQIMLLNFGIISSLKVKKARNYPQNKYFRLSIYGKDALKFVEQVRLQRKEKYQKAGKLLKLSPNPNVDLIPNISALLKTLGQKYLHTFALLTKQGWIYQSGVLAPQYVFTSLRSYNSGDRMPGYQSLEKMLDFYYPLYQQAEYQGLEKIWQRNFYWDRVGKITRTSGVGYDFLVPGSDSFVGNGFVNHNTIFLNSLILSLLQKNSPETLRFVLVDPKRVEFSLYHDLPHLAGPIIYEPERVVAAINWLITEMEQRFHNLSAVSARDIGSYNIKVQSSKLNAKGFQAMPYLVFIIDELADLMAAKGREVEAGIVRLAQLSRAVGIHLVLATQRPSVEVLTGLIKANITSRVALKVATQVDSRTILDMAGAEKLLGSGDMLYISSTIPKPKRLQSALVTEREVKRVIEWFRTQPEYFSYNALTTELAQVLQDRSPAAGLARRWSGGPAAGGNSSNDEDVSDQLYQEAKRVVIESGKASASLLQRRLRIGYARAARLLDILEQRGIIGPPEGARPRKVLL